MVAIELAQNANAHPGPLTISRRPTPGGSTIRFKQRALPATGLTARLPFVMLALGSSPREGPRAGG
jgi:hypothetical protein